MVQLPCYDWEIPPEPQNESQPPATQPPATPWLRDLLGVDFFAVVVRVGFDRRGDPTTVTDAGLEHLKGLTKLQGLWISDAPITDAGLEHLKNLGELRGLGIVRTKISDVGLEYLKGLTQLQKLSLEGNWITDAGLEHLKGLTQLDYLSLEGTSVRDIASLRDLTKLESS